MYPEAVLMLVRRLLVKSKGFWIIAILVTLALYQSQKHETETRNQQVISESNMIKKFRGYNDILIMEFSYKVSKETVLSNPTGNRLLKEPAQEHHENDIKETVERLNLCEKGVKIIEMEIQKIISSSSKTSMKFEFLNKYSDRIRDQKNEKHRNVYYTVQCLQS